MFRSPVLRTGDNLSITTLFSSSADHINSGSTDWKSSLDPMANHKKKKMSDVGHNKSVG